jgi:hypothetical protein
MLFIIPLCVAVRWKHSIPLTARQLPAFMSGYPHSLRVSYQPESRRDSVSGVVNSKNLRRDNRFGPIEQSPAELSLRKLSYNPFIWHCCAASRGRALWTSRFGFGSRARGPYTHWRSISLLRAVVLKTARISFIDQGIVLIIPSYTGGHLSCHCLSGSVREDVSCVRATGLACGALRPQ